MRHYCFAANTGFLWPDQPFLDKIALAKKAGFDALEFHDEAQRCDVEDLKNALAQAALPVLGMNVRMGETLGCAAIPDQQAQARKDIAVALDLAQELGVGRVHVLAGNTRDEKAFETYVENLKFAVGYNGVKILIEPLCGHAAPDYFLNDIETAARIVTAVNHPDISIMFDCYHILMESGDILGHFLNYKDIIGHIQIAARKNRGEPDLIDPDFSQLLPAFMAGGYDGAFGCEYRQTDPTDTEMKWRAELISTLENNAHGKGNGNAHRR